MRKDLKIGMLVGVMLAGIAFIYICTRSDLSTRSTMLKANQQPLPEPEYVEPGPGPAGEVSIHFERQPSACAGIEPPPQIETQTYEVPERIKTHRFYIVRKGDTLSAISRRYYGSANKWHGIYEANYDVLRGNPNKLSPGMKLILPD